jgi:hypothetical protein
MCRVYAPPTVQGFLFQHKNYGCAGCIPLPTVQGVLFQHLNYGCAGCIPCRQCRVSFSITKIMVVQGVSLSTTSSKDAQCVFLFSMTCGVYPSPPSAVKMCRMYRFSKAAVWTCSLVVQGVSFPTTTSVDVQGVFLFTFSGVTWKMYCSLGVQDI